MVAIPSPGTTGNDIIIPGDGGDTLYGDPFDVKPLTKGHGGNDRLSAAGEDNHLFGDAQHMSGHGGGGNDRLASSGFATFLYGDAYSMSGHARGGNDSLNAGGAYNRLSGDAGSMSGNTHGGNDNLTGGDHSIL